MPDAVVVGSGPNGLVAANLLADAGWSVVVVEGADTLGGGVRSAHLLAEDYITDLCSAFYPFAAASPAISELGLHEYGLQWSHAPAVLAHPLPDGSCPALYRDPDKTTASIAELGDGDGESWKRLCDVWRLIGDDLLDALFTPFPPVAAGARLAARLRIRGGLDFARMALMPVRRLAEEQFNGPGAMLLAGCALHADLAPESSASAMFGWLLAMLGQTVGFPTAAGGAQSLTDAMVRRLVDRGGQLLTGTPVTEVVVRRRRAVGVRLADGREIDARRAVIADVVAPLLYGGLVSWDDLPAALQTSIRTRFQWDYATVKVDWAVDTGVPWEADEAREAGTVHIGTLDEMTLSSAQIAMGHIPADPFMLVGQMTTADPSRSPQGTQSLWAYTHVPRTVRGDAGGSLSGSWDVEECDAMADRLEQRIESLAPGFRDRITTRHVMGPPQLQAHNPNLVGGAINGGTMQLHQQLVFRPTPGLGRPQTPIDRLFLASASAHPGGGVHGACGANAAHAALRGEIVNRFWSSASRHTQRRE